MRPLVFFLLVFALVPSAEGQPGASPLKVWIFLTEAPDGAARGIALDQASVSPHALTRRHRRGSRTLARADMPVAETYLDQLRALGVEPLVASRWFNAVSAMLTPEQAQSVRALPFVRDLHPVGRLTTERTPPVSPVRLIDYGPSALQLDLINARTPIEDGFIGTGIIVGFLDTTFDFGHPALAPIAASGRLLGIMDFTGQQQSSTHGLSVASVAVGFDEGELVGPGYGAQVLAATTEYAPTETHQEEDFFVAGLEWLEANGADVVNVSLGYSTFDPGEGDFTYDDLDGNTTLVTRAVDLAAALGVVVVTSAGNEGNSDWQFITAPADADSVITVGAMRSDSTRTSFSSIGPTADGRIKPDVMALGSQVVVARPGADYGTGGGTSFSAPAVTGVVAQILQANPSLNPIDIRDLLRRTASQPNAPDNERGWGVVNAAAAVQEALALASEEPGIIDEAPVSVPSYVVRRGTRTLTVALTGAPAPDRVTFYDVLGRRVGTLTPLGSSVREGRTLVRIALPTLPAGLFFYRLTGSDFDTGGRLIIQ